MESEAHEFLDARTQGPAQPDHERVFRLLDLLTKEHTLAGRTGLPLLQEADLPIAEQLSALSSHADANLRGGIGCEVNLSNNQLMQFDRLVS